MDVSVQTDWDEIKQNNAMNRNLRPSTTRVQKVKWLLFLSNELHVSHIELLRNEIRLNRMQEAQVEEIQS